MRTLLTITAIFALSAPAGLLAAEKKVKLKDLPPPVQQAVKDHTGNGTLVELTREVEGGKTVYEAEFKENGKEREVTLDPDGKVLSVEQEVELDSLPAAAKAAIEKKAAGGKIEKVEKVTEGQAEFYEASLKVKRKKSEFKVQADGTEFK